MQLSLLDSSQPRQPVKQRGKQPGLPSTRKRLITVLKRRLYTERKRQGLRGRYNRRGFTTKQNGYARLIRVLRRRLLQLAGTRKRFHGKIDLRSPEQVRADRIASYWQSPSHRARMTANQRRHQERINPGSGQQAEARRIRNQTAKFLLLQGHHPTAIADALKMPARTISYHSQSADKALRASFRKRVQLRHRLLSALKRRRWQLQE